MNYYKCGGGQSSSGGPTGEWVTISNNKSYYKKLGDIIYLKLKAEKNKPSGGIEGNLPVSLLPDKVLHYCINDNVKAQIRNNQYGTIFISNTDTDNDYWFQVSYAL